jgi:hypothetical protein
MPEGNGVGRLYPQKKGRCIPFAEKILIHNIYDQSAKQNRFRTFNFRYEAAKEIEKLSVVAMNDWHGSYFPGT